MRRHDRKAFTLVELITVLAVVMLLILIVLPAIQRGRGIYCRTYCDKNLRNIGLALSMYTTREGVFPSSTTNGPGRALNHSWIALLLGDLDEPGLYNSYNFDIENYDPENRFLVGISFRIALCPESRTHPMDFLPSEKVRRADGSTYPPGSQFTRNNYAANWGGGRLPGFGDDFARTMGNNRGVMPPGGSSPNIRPADVVDGLGSTVAVAEKLDGQGWAVGGYAGSEFDVATSPLPPDHPEARDVVTGSCHRDVLNVGMADGSVRGIRGSIARQVWYALMTRNGGEAIKPDDSWAGPPAHE